MCLCLTSTCFSNLFLLPYFLHMAYSLFFEDVPCSLVPCAFSVFHLETLVFLNLTALSRVEPNIIYPRKLLDTLSTMDLFIDSYDSPFFPALVLITWEDNYLLDEECGWKELKSKYFSSGGLLFSMPIASA